MKMYLVRFLEAGTMYTVIAKTNRSAAKLFVTRYNVERGTDFAVKERGVSEDWTTYTRTVNGIRELG